MTARSPNETRETWMRRVEAWRASGERADEFSKRDGGYMGSTLRYWASRLKQDAKPEREVRLARVTRRRSPVVVEARATAIVVEVIPSRVRIGVAPGADRTTLAMVLDVLGLER